MSAIANRKTSAAVVSVLSNTTLVVSKLIVGLMIGSVSVISEAAHSSVDLVAAVIAFFAVRTAGKPADRNHPFGHGKFENLSGTIEAFLIFLAAVWIIFEAVKKLRHPEPLDVAGWGVAVMLLSAVVNIAVSAMLFKVAGETESVALEADAWHLRTDVYTSVGVMAGLGAIWIGRRYYPNIDLRWLDPAAALGVAVLIIKTAYELTVESARDLLDASLPPEEESLIRREVAVHAPGVKGIDHLRTRKTGSIRFVEMTIFIDPEMTVDESHRVTEVISSNIAEHYPGISVTIHVEPWNNPE